MNRDKDRTKGSLVPSSNGEIQKYSSKLISRGLELVKIIERGEKWDLLFFKDGESLEAYCTKIKQFPLLTREEEFQLAVRYRKDNDIEAAHKLITSNLKFVVKAASKYKLYGVQLQDLIQEGNTGLIMAVKKFNPYKGYRLISYAIWWIRAYIQNCIIKTLMRRLDEREIYVINNRIIADEPLTLQEIGDHLRLSREQVRQIEGKALKKLKREFGAMVTLNLSHKGNNGLAKLITAIRNAPD